MTVVSGGNGFWVQLIGSDNKSSDALLKWARGFVEARQQPAGERQLSAR